MCVAPTEITMQPTMISSGDRWGEDGSDHPLVLPRRRCGDSITAWTALRPCGTMKVCVPINGMTAHPQRSMEFRSVFVANPLPRRTTRSVVAPGLLHRQFGRARRDGVAIEVDESRIGVGCFAAPILDPKGI